MVPEKSRKKKDSPVSLRPLGFEEAVSDLLKVKPKKKRGNASKRLRGDSERR